MRRAAALLVLLLALSSAAVRAADAPPNPPWVADVLGRYYGTVRNAGRMACERTELSLQDGHLVGHYWIDDTDPFEGTLTDFKPSTDTSGSFTWTDRYGSGTQFMIFASDHSSFAGGWGADMRHPSNPVYGLRTPNAACGAQVSDLGRSPPQG